MEEVEKQKDFFKLDLLEIKKVLFDLNIEFKDIPSGNEIYCRQLIYSIISKCWYDYEKRYSVFDLDHGQKHIHDMMIRNFNILSWYIKTNGFEEYQKIIGISLRWYQCLSLRLCWSGSIWSCLSL